MVDPVAADGGILVGGSSCGDISCWVARPGFFPELSARPTGQWGGAPARSSSASWDAGGPAGRAGAPTGRPGPPGRAGSTPGRRRRSSPQRTCRHCRCSPPNRVPSLPPNRGSNEHRERRERLARISAAQAEALGSGDRKRAARLALRRERVAHEIEQLEHESGGARTRARVTGGRLARGRPWERSPAGRLSRCTGGAAAPRAQRRRRSPARLPGTRGTGRDEPYPLRGARLGTPAHGAARDRPAAGCPSRGRAVAAERVADPPAGAPEGSRRHWFGRRGPSPGAHSARSPEQSAGIGGHA